MLKIYIIIVFLAGGARLAFAQKTIVIDDSILVHTNHLKVVFFKLKGFNAFPKMTFGDCTVINTRKPLNGNCFSCYLT